jgi:type II secretory pathway pseudopilin PulG
LKPKNSLGFTLLEVTLAIVIGIFMMAGATILYDQSRSSSGNSRAQAKSASLQQVVEEFAAENGGTYPRITSVRSLW